MSENALPDTPLGSPGQAATLGLTDLRLQLSKNGYSPVPVIRHDAPIPGAGKRPTMKNWQNICQTADEAEIRRWETDPNQSECKNTGILCGILIAIDIDVPDPELAIEISELADQFLPTTPLIRIGKAPKSLRLFRADGVHCKESTAPFVLPNGTKVQVEALGAGNQFVAFGIHPETQHPYKWCGPSPVEVPIDKLPVLSSKKIKAFLASAESLFRSSGGQSANQVKSSQTTKGGMGDRPDHPIKTNPDINADFFQRVNHAALMPDALAKWVPLVVPMARLHPSTGCWRVTSAALGRDLEEDWSIAPNGSPSPGGRDFGLEKPFSPIDALIEHGGATGPHDAAMLICEMIGVDPITLGWHPNHRNNSVVPDSVRDASKLDLPVIRVDPGELNSLVTAAEDAILKSEMPVFQRGQQLVRPATCEVGAAHGKTTKSAALIQISRSSMIDILSKSARWMRYSPRSKRLVDVDPPPQIAEILLSRFGEWRFPAVSGIITCPTLRPDGSVLAQPGYDRETRLYFARDPILALISVPENPTRDDAIAAFKHINALLDEFPFTDETSRSVALSGLMTPVLRGAFPVAPMHVFRASTAGSGKSYMADLAAALATGRPCPVVSAARDESEYEKRLVGLLLGGYQIISLDNVNGELGGDLLCQAVERPFIRLRALGSSVIQEIESRATYFATGNNLRVKGDMVRRTLVCTLDANLERPELRDFTFDPAGIVIADRAKYVSAVLTIARAFALSGTKQQAPPLASYNEWSRWVREPLIWLGCADPAASMETARQEDPELAELREVMASWYLAFGKEGRTPARSLNEVISEASKSIEGADGSRRAHPELFNALSRVCGDRGVINPKSLGRWLAARVDRIVTCDLGASSHQGKRALRIFKGTEARGGAATWGVGVAQ